MSAEIKKEIQLEIGHVLFIDIVAYSKMATDDQRAAIEQLNQIVQSTDEYRTAESENRLLKLATGDGMALIFYHSPEDPVECALEISRALKEQDPKLRLRMGVHSGPVSGVVDVNGRANVAGAGLNTAQRVMDCGDAGHILLSTRVAEDLEQFKHWRPHLYHIGEYEVKDGDKIDIVNLFTAELGNSERPKRMAMPAQKTDFAPVMKRRAPSRKPVLIIAACLAVAALAVGTFLFWHRQKAKTSASALSIPEKSIAVLPFQNLSRDPDNAYFADGIQDEILTRLSKIADLKVISRTSTQQYQSKPGNLSEIARQLGVAHIVEGSVQKSGEAVRVNVQLIKAANDSHLWADTFDRKLTDIFSVESEVAKAIAEQLRVHLTGREEQVIAAKPTDNPAAYDAYLRGLAIEHNQYGFDAEAGAAQAYLESVRLDPTFALAWANLAIARSPLYLYGVDATTNSAAAVRDAADRAMTLQPDLAEAWAAQGAYRYRVARDFSGALQAYEEAHKRLPNSSRVLLEMAVVETRLGRWDVAEAHYRKAMELDPRSSSLLAAVAREFLARLRR